MFTHLGKLTPYAAAFGLKQQPIASPTSLLMQKKPSQKTSTWATTWTPLNTQSEAMEISQQVMAVLKEGGF